MKASIFINYKIHKSKFSNAEKSEEASFDTDQSSFVEQASILLDVIGKYVKAARTKVRSRGPR